MQQLSQSLIAFQGRLEKMWKHYSKQARRQEVTCFRFYDHDLPEAPLAIDFLEGAVHLSEYRRRHGMEEDEHQAWMGQCKEIVAGVCALDPDLVYTKVRQRKAGRQGQYQKATIVRVERIVHEGGHAFILNLTEYLDTGLFLDHRITRKMVELEASGKRVLNLFCYTGSFSVYAAAGGASRVTSVDLSKTYLHWAKRNLQFNHLFHPEKHQLIHADAADWLRNARGEQYDLIICDPPSFSNSKRMDGTFDVQRDQVSLIRDMLRMLAPDGKIYFSNNLSSFKLEAEALPQACITNITAATTPFDFQGRLKRWCYLITHC